MIFFVSCEQLLVLEMLLVREAQLSTGLQLGAVGQKGGGIFFSETGESLGPDVDR